MFFSLFFKGLFVLVDRELSDSHFLFSDSVLIFVYIFQSTVVVLVSSVSYLSMSVPLFELNCRLSTFWFILKVYFPSVFHLVSGMGLFPVFSCLALPLPLCACVE